jgi:uncharacterized damage-inducible protein DinB
MIEFIAGILARDLAALKRELGAYPSDEAVWRDVPGLSNSGGTLFLHLAGNLRHFIGARLGGTGYIRDREAEFRVRGLSRVAIAAEIDAAAEAVASTLSRLNEKALAADYPLTFDGVTVSTADFLLHLAGHLTYHLGQIDYHRKAVSGGGGVGVLPIGKLASARSGGEGPAKDSAAAPALRQGIDEAIPILERTPRVLRALLEGLPEPWITANEGAGTWSPFNVVGHLIDGEESDWIARATIILTEGTARPFDPFNRFGHLERDRGASLSSLLDRFERLRAENVETLRRMSLDAALLEKQGTHPDFGAVTLGQLLATWVVHDLGHIAQITRVMAKRYAADVGPWKIYLPVLGR